MKLTITVPNDKMRLFQDLVKFYGLYFEGRPLQWSTGYRVTVVSDDPSRYTRFNETWDRITAPYVPPKKSLWQKIVGLFA